MRFQPKQMGNESSDRRARVRRTPSALTYLDAGEGNGGIVLNISESGVAIAVAQGMTAERIPSLTFRLPQLDRTFQAAGEIVWRSESTKSVGLRFLDLTDQDRGQIRNWICAEIVSAEMEATHEVVREGSAVNPVLVMPSPRKTGPGVPFDTVPDEERAAAFERMFPSEASLKAAPAKNQLELSLMPEAMPAVASDIASEVTAALHEETTAETKLASDNVANALTAPPVEETVANGAELAAADVVPATQTEEPASQTTPDLDWRDQWERFHAEREEIARAPHLDIGLYVPIAPGIAELAASPEISGMVVADPEPVSTSASVSGASDSVKSDAVAATVAALAAITPDAMTPDATAPTFVPATLSRAAVTPAARTRTAPGHGERRKSGPSAGLPAFLGGSLASSARLKVPAVGAVAAKTTPRRSSAGNTLSVATLGLVLVLLCFALGYVIQPGAFHFSGWQTGNAEPEAAAVNTDGTSTTSPTTTPATSNSPSSAPDAAAGGTTAGDAAQTEKQNSVVAAPAKDTTPVSAYPQASPPSITPEKARDAEAKMNSVTSATDMRATAAASPGTPSPDIVAPSPVSFFPVTAPSAGSPPKLVQLPEETVVDTPAILIRSREFLFVPAAPGAESTHPLARIHVGDRIAKAIPNYPEAGAQKGPDGGGTVRLRSTIGTDGTISAVQTISGPTNLIALAEAAVRQWRYRPSDIDGKPISVAEDVTVEFRPVR